ncbi:Hsp70 family protein [Myxococcota bacterium]
MTTAGIDLGTTNTVIAIDGAPQPIGAFGANTLPSVVSFPATGAQLVGSEARRRLGPDPKNTIYGAKRLIAERMRSESARVFGKRFPFDLVANPAGIVAFHTRAGDFTSEDIGTQVLRTALDAASKGAKITRAVITVPSEFKTSQREATKQIATLTGLETVDLMDEPAAAAQAFLAPNESLNHVGVYDFGGGTFDFAVIECSTKQTLTHGGDLYLGGDDVDVGIAKWVAARVLEEHRWDLASDLSTFASLIAACERIKIQLCDHDRAVIDLRKVDPAAPSQVRMATVPKEVMEEVATNLVRKSFVVCDDVLARAGVNARSLDAVFLAGGATYLPPVRRMVAAYFGKQPRCSLNPLTVVASGASLAAKLN